MCGGGRSAGYTNSIQRSPVTQMSFAGAQKPPAGPGQRGLLPSVSSGCFAVLQRSPPAGLSLLTVTKQPCQLPPSSRSALPPWLLCILQPFSTFRDVSRGVLKTTLKKQTKTPKEAPKKATSNQRSLPEPTQQHRECCR